MQFCSTYFQCKKHLWTAWVWSSGFAQFSWILRDLNWETRARGKDTRGKFTESGFFQTAPWDFWGGIFLLSVVPLSRCRLLATTTRIHFVFAFLFKFFNHAEVLKNNIPNLQKKTTIWRILVVVVKGRHHAIVLIRFPPPPKKKKHSHSAIRHNTDPVLLTTSTVFVFNVHLLS